MDKIKTTILQQISHYLEKQLVHIHDPSTLVSDKSPQTTKEVIDSLNLNLETPKELALGDYAFPCFQLAKVLRKSPNLIAQEIIKSIQIERPITRIEIKGAYLNFFIDKSYLNEKILKKIVKKKEKYGLLKQKKRIMLEYSSPNTNKPLHLGHVRNCTLGDAIATMLEKNGNKVIRACLVNDRGIHICKSMLAYKKWGNNSLPDCKSDFFVGRYYVFFCKEAEKNHELEQEAQKMLQEWEAGNKEIVALWKKMNKWVYKGFNESYKKMDICFHKMYYESKIYKKGKYIVKNGLKKRIFKEENGAIYADLTSFNLPKKVLMRADGTSLYITQDIFLAIEKMKKNKLHASYYVVGSEQNLHFQQLFAILKQLKYKWADKLKHISYGMVYLPDGKMKSREGKVVDADDLVEEIIELAKYEIKLRHKDLSDKAVEKRAKQIGLGALRFYLLKTDLTKDIYFDPKESISFEGETAPYIQYSIARINSIQKKYKKLIKKVNKNTKKKSKKILIIHSKKIDFSLFNETENKIIKLLSNYPIIVGDCIKQLKPSLLTRYLLDITQLFNMYYHETQILQSAPNVMEARIYLITSVKQVIKNGLELLHIESPEEM